MTIYKCKRGCKFELDDSIAENDPALSIINPGVRAYCAFCEHKDFMLTTWDDEAKTLRYSGDICTWIREDESWDDWDPEREQEWDDGEGRMTDTKMPPPCAEECPKCSGDCEQCTNQRYCGEV